MPRPAACYILRRDMRVVFLSHNRSDSNDAYTSRLQTLRDAVAREGIDASLESLGDPPLGRPTLLHPMKLAGGGRIAAALARADVVHAGSAAVAFTCAFLTPRRGRRVVFDMHGDTAAEKRLAARGALDPIGRLRVHQESIKERIGLRACDRVIVVSRPLLERVARLGVPESRIEIVRNGVDLARFPMVEPVPARPSPLVVYAGRFDEWQGVRHLEHLAAHAGDRYRLRVVGFAAGDHEARARIAAAAARGGAPREAAVELIDWTNHGRLLPLLSEADALLIPREKNDATEVAMPTKFAEYLSLGRPILLTRVGEPADWVEAESCGLVVEPSGPALLDGVLRLAALGAEERRAMGRRARALAEREFRWESIGRRYADYLKALVSAG